MDWPNYFFKEKPDDGMGMSKLTNTGSALPVIVFTLSTLLAIKNMGAKPFPTDDVNLFFLLIPQMFLGPILQIATLSEKFLFIVPIFGLFLILALAGIGFSMLYFRKWLWAQATLAVLIVSFLCAAPFQTQSFLFPYVDLISPIIEQNEFGIFYRLARFWDQTESVIHYDVDFNNGAFYVRQNLGRTLVFSPEFEGADFPYMENITVEVSAPYAEQQYGNTLPESFECLEGGMPENTTTPVICQKFLLEDIYFNYVLGSKNGYDPRGIIHDIAIADDKQTAVVVLSSDFTPEEVYFVNLRPYNQPIQ